MHKGVQEAHPNENDSGEQKDDKDHNGLFGLHRREICG